MGLYKQEMSVHWLFNRGKNKILLDILKKVFTYLMLNTKFGCLYIIQMLQFLMLQSAI